MNEIEVTISGVKDIREMSDEEYTKFKKEVLEPAVHKLINKLHEAMDEQEESKRKK